MMKKNLLSVLLAGLFLSLSSSMRPANLYQVISAHPHDLKELEGKVETVYQNGRLWIVELKAGADKELLSHLRPITGSEKSYLYKSPKKNKSFPANDEVKAVIDQVDPELIKQEVLSLTAFETRAAGTEGNRRATQSVQDKLAALGYEARQICYAPGVCSVIAEKAGSELPQEVLLVLAHLDSVGHDFAGADDNASGTATLLEIARVLKDHDNRRTLRFFATNGEELGLLGAKHYAEQLERSGEIGQIKLAINMDMVGYNHNGIVELETNSEYEALAQWFAGLASQYTKLKTKITLGAWGSDHVPFLDAGVSTLLTIEDWSTKTPCYHQRCDTADTLNYEYAGEIAKLNAAAVLKKDAE